MSFCANYLSEVAAIAGELDVSKVEEMIDILVKVREERGRLYILGIGGSAGNASHAVNDFRKLTLLDAYAPTDNISEITARTNDEGFHTVFENYLRVSHLNEKDCILILSVGGGNIELGVSTNLCKAIDFARSSKAKIIGIVGKESGYTQEKADICLKIPTVNSSTVTPHSESFQAIVWHLMVSHPKLKINQTKW